MRERHRRAARRGSAIDLDRRDAALLGVDHGLAVAGQLHVVQLVVSAGHHARGAARHRINWMLWRPRSSMVKNNP